MRIYLDQNWLCGHCARPMERVVTKPHTDEMTAHLVIFCGHQDCKMHGMRAMMPSYTAVKPLKVFNNIRIGPDMDAQCPDDLVALCIQADRLDNLHIAIPLRVKRSDSIYEAVQAISRALQKLDSTHWDSWQL